MNTASLPSSLKRILCLALICVFATTGFAATPAGAAHEPPEPGCFGQIDLDVVIIMDRSGSMAADNRMQAARDAGRALLQTLGPKDQSALVSFATDVRLDRNLNFEHTGPAPSTQWHIDQQTEGGRTAIWKGLRMARFELINQPHVDPAPYSHASRIGDPTTAQAMVLLSDGDETVGGGSSLSEAQQAKAVGITIFSVALGDDISTGGRAKLQDIATSAHHYFESPDSADLPAVFERISLLLRDIANPNADLLRPGAPHLIYHDDRPVGLTPVALPAVKGHLFPAAEARDDCLVERVIFEADVYDEGVLQNTVALGDVHTRTWTRTDQGELAHLYRPEQPFFCPELVGPHTLRATAIDWLGNTATDSRQVVCVKEHVTADATAMHARVTNPAEPIVESAGAHLGGGFGPDEVSSVNATGGTPFPFEISALYDHANGIARDGDVVREGHARSRIHRLALDALPLDLTVLETRACAGLDTDMLRGGNRDGVLFWTCFDHDTLRVDQDPFGGFVLDSPMPPGDCETGTYDDPERGTVQRERCWEAYQAFEYDACTAFGCLVNGGPGNQGSGMIEVYVGERVTETGGGFIEMTVNGLHIVHDGPQSRAELILAQSYAGASAFDADLLSGPYRALDDARDIGRPGDAPDDPDAAWDIHPGAYGARLAEGGDVDAYRTQVDHGDKLHFAFVPSHQQTVTVRHADSSSTSAGSLAPIKVTLLDPLMNIRDTKTAIAGVPTQLELNADRAGTWTAVIESANGTVEMEYTMTLTVTPAPLTQNNDALVGQDASGDCLDAMFVGPGVHVGTLEHSGDDDWYRFRLFEGQKLVLALRPGDTVDSSEMRLRFYDPTCKLVNTAAPLPLVLGLKGEPSLLVWDVPVGAEGNYRAAVEYVNGVGTYELAIATSESGLLWGVP